MMGRLDDKIALITGAAAARGLGAAQAALFAAHGAHVVLSDVDDMAGLARVRDIAARGGRAEFIHLDVTQEASWTAAMAHIEQGHGRLDVLSNNAGIFRIEDIESTSLESWNEVITVNQTGVFLGMKHAVPLMRRSRGGSIINFSSIGGIVGFGPAAAYQASKGAVRLLSRNAAMHCAPDRIRVNSIHPGVIVTQMADTIDPRVIQGFETATPFGLGQPEDVAYAALYLASDESKYMTGAELVIDGGYTAR